MISTDRRTFRTRVRTILNPQDRVRWPIIAAVVALAVFLSTLQTEINGSAHAYATDVGEIQNALPRWGLIHRSGYPLYTAVGSLFVTVLRWAGIEPAASASLYSALWGAAAVALLVVLAQELGIPGPAATLGALAAGLSTATWMFASLAEVHTMTAVFSLATLIFSLRFGRSGARRDLLLLALFSTQGVMHQRSVVLLVPAAIVLVSPQLAALWRNLLPAVGVGMLAPLIYLYMPLRVWMGATWVFGSPGTWKGFWEMVFDNRGGRVFTLQADPGEWQRRLHVLIQILGDDMWWPLLGLGLLGLVLLALQKGRGRDGLAMTLAWIPNALLTLVIWRNRVIDAQLAAKMPIAIMAGLGLAVVLHGLSNRSRYLGWGASLALLIALGAWVEHTRPFVLSITRDPSSQAVIATAARVRPSPDGRPITLATPWGQDYWALTYAQACQDRLPGLNLVDHNADLPGILAREGRLLVLSKTLHVFAISWWERRLGPLYLASAVPGVVELRSSPVTAQQVPAGIELDMENGIIVRSASLEWATEGELWLAIDWEAMRDVGQDYSVAVHLVAHDPPRGGEDILSQADAARPVGGWYATSQWQRGQVIHDCYAIPIPAGTTPVAVRVALYRSDPQAGFLNSPWLSLAVPQP